MITPTPTDGSVSQPLRQPVKGDRFWLGILLVWGLALALRFWGLGRFNTLVFDEIYFARFGYDYLNQTPLFDAHPPLGKYLIAFGIWVKGFNPFGYRWMNALVGSFIPVLGVGIAYQLNQRYRFAILTGLLLCLDGLLLVESRYALINVYMICFGLLGQWFVLLALRDQGLERWVWLTLAGVAFGATISVKWNGLGFVLATYVLWAIIHGICFLDRRYHDLELGTKLFPRRLSLPFMSQLDVFQMLVWIPMLMGVVYCLAWIPHLAQNPRTTIDPQWVAWACGSHAKGAQDFSCSPLENPLNWVHNFWHTNQEMFGYHKRLGSGANIHAYCAPWYTWPPMWRPVSYFSQRALLRSEPIPINGPTLPWEATRWLYSVVAMGNPLLWWASTSALLWSAGFGVRHFAWGLQRWYLSVVPVSHERLPAESAWVCLFIGVNYATNLLPWTLVSRCTFLYHYLPASIIGMLALAWVLDNSFSSANSHFIPDQRPYLPSAIAWGVMAIIVVGFLFWLPIYLGLPLTPWEWRLRMLPPWI